MKASVNTIKYIVLLSVVTFLLTYCISLNEENKWVILNTPWLSSSFAFAVASGSFASLIVLFACELQKYFSIKRQTEDYIFSQLFALYSQIAIIHYNIRRKLAECDSLVPTNLIDEIAYRGQLYLNNLTGIEYVTFNNKTVIRDALDQYKGENGMSIRSFLQNTLFLKMALSEDKIALLKQGRDELITSHHPKTHQSLKKLFHDSSQILSFIERSLDRIDQAYNNRFHWSAIKRKVILGEENFASTRLDDFLKSPKIQFK